MTSFNDAMNNGGRLMSYVLLKAGMGLSNV